MARRVRATECHPGERHYARGLCKPCYESDVRRRRRAANRGRVRETDAWRAVEGEAELGKQKRCSCCGEWWPVDPEFYFHKPDSGDGYQHWCRACIYDYREKRTAAKRLTSEYGERKERKLAEQRAYRNRPHRFHQRSYRLDAPKGRSCGSCGRLPENPVHAA